jgi:HAMP domain-containing protein
VLFTVLLATLAFVVALVAMLRWARRMLEPRCERARAREQYSSTRTPWTGPTTALLCGAESWLGSALQELAEHRRTLALMVLVMVTSLPMVLALCLSADRYVALVDFGIDGLVRVYALVCSVPRMMAGALHAVVGAIKRLADDVFADLEPPEAEEPQTHRRRQQQQQQQQQRHRQQQQQQQRHRNGFSYNHEHRPSPPRPERRPERRPETFTETLRTRAMKLPEGEVRSTLLARDHFEALGIARDASSTEAKKAFHRLALKLHPDKNKQELAEEAFKRVEEAHRTLTDANLRKAYELTLPDPAPRPSARQPGQQYGTYNHHEATPGANTPWAPSTGRPPSAKERPFVWRSKNGTKYHAM